MFNIRTRLTTKAVALFSRALRAYYEPQYKLVGEIFHECCVAVAPIFAPWCIIQTTETDAKYLIGFHRTVVNVFYGNYTIPDEIRELGSEFSSLVHFAEEFCDWQTYPDATARHLDMVVFMRDKIIAAVNNLNNKEVPV